MTEDTFQTLRAPADVDAEEACFGYWEMHGSFPAAGLEPIEDMAFFTAAAAGLSIDNAWPCLAALAGMAAEGRARGTASHDGSRGRARLVAGTSGRRSRTAAPHVPSGPGRAHAAALTPLD